MNARLYRLLLLFFLFSGNSISTFSQAQIQFEKQVHDFGTVANLNYPPASFIFTNSGTDPLAVLLVNKSNSVKVSYPQKFIQPGETSQLLIYPNLNKLGPFTEKIVVVTNGQPSDVELIIKGDVVSIQACFPNPNDWNIRKVIVTDSKTSLPIPAASFEFLHNMSNKGNGKTDRNGEWTGEMKIGQYEFYFQSEGYVDLEVSKFVSRSVPVLFFEMDPIDEPEAVSEPVSEVPIVVPVQETAQVEDPVNPELLSVAEYKANNIVLLVDVSLSMRSANKLGLLKESMKNLVGVLRTIDNVSLISYAQSPTVLIESVPGSQKEVINAKIDRLKAAGITNGVKGLEKAYAIAKSKKVTTGNNQVILATDGQFTGGTVNAMEIQQFIQQQAEAGIILSIVGFGIDDDAKQFMAKMADSGKGTYIHVSSKDDISETLIEEIKAKSKIED